MQDIWKLDKSWFYSMDIVGQGTIGKCAKLYISIDEGMKGEVGCSSPVLERRLYTAPMQSPR